MVLGEMPRPGSLRARVKHLGSATFVHLEYKGFAIKLQRHGLFNWRVNSCAPPPLGRQSREEALKAGVAGKT
jgi:hypothetical protein